MDAGLLTSRDQPLLPTPPTRPFTRDHQSDERRPYYHTEKKQRSDKKRNSRKYNESSHYYQNDSHAESRLNSRDDFPRTPLSHPAHSHDMNIHEQDRSKRKRSFNHDDGRYRNDTRTVASPLINHSSVHDRLRTDPCDLKREPLLSPPLMDRRYSDVGQARPRPLFSPPLATPPKRYQSNEVEYYSSERGFRGSPSSASVLDMYSHRRRNSSRY